MEPLESGTKSQQSRFLKGIVRSKMEIVSSFTLIVVRNLYDFLLWNSYPNRTTIDNLALCVCSEVMWQHQQMSIK